MNALLVTDTHWTDSTLDEYRWTVFEHLRRICSENKITDIIHLGDCVDRKDRHSSILVNRIIEEFSYLQSMTGAEIKVLSGNHDKPLTGPYFWKFLDKLGIAYIVEPLLYKDVWFLPFSPNPVEDWSELDLKAASTICMHQTGQNAIVERDRVLISHNLPSFPEGVKVYSGDVHRPQDAGGVTYVGTPHPIKFSENWPNRVITLDSREAVSHWLPSIKRAILDISSSKELAKQVYKKGDQLRIRYALKGDQLVSWPYEQEAIRQWAQENELHIASIEAVLAGDSVSKETSEKIQTFQIMKPEEVVKQFGEDENLNEAVITMGIDLLRTV